MIRKFAIACAALAVIGAASLASTAPAEAGWKGHHHHHSHGHKKWHGHKTWGHHHIHVRPVYSCWRKVWVHSPYGGFFKRVNVCY